MRSAWDLHFATSYASGWSPAAAAPERRASVPLPEPRPLGGALDELLAGRASCRRFSGAALELDVLASLLQAAYGTGPDVTVEGVSFPSRPVPSAGATYPLQVHVFARAVNGLQSGSFRYVSEDARARRRPGPAFSSRRSPRSSSRSRTWRRPPPLSCSLGRSTGRLPATATADTGTCSTRRAM